MAIDLSPIVIQAHEQSVDITEEQLKAREQALNQRFISNINSLISELESAAVLEQNTTMMEKMVNAQLNSSTSYDHMRNSVNNIIANKNGYDAFKKLTMLTAWYQQQLTSLYGGSIQTKVVIEFHGQIKIATLNEEISEKTDLIKMFDSLYYIDKKASSKGGGLTARYRTTNKALENNTTSFTTVETTMLEEAYFKILQRANAMKKGKDGYSSTKTVIPVKDNNGEILYYSLSTLGDMKEAYLNMKLSNNVPSASSTEEYIKILLDEATTNVTNTAGLFKGDFSININGINTEIAAKSRGASAMGILQALDYAYYLKESIAIGGSRGGQIDINDIVFKQRKNKNQSVENAQITDEEMKSILDQILKDIFG